MQPRLRALNLDYSEDEQFLIFKKLAVHNGLSGLAFYAMSLCSIRGCLLLF